MEDFNVLYSDDALNDLRDIYSYIALSLKEPQTAARLIERLRLEIRSLGNFPMKYRLVDFEPMRSFGMRQTAIDNYVVFYIPDSGERTVTIVRVLYGKRNLAEQFL